MAPIHTLSLAPRSPGAGLSASASTQNAHNYEKTVVCIVASCAFYAILGLTIYAFMNRFRLVPEWYKSSARNLQYKIMLILWFPAIMILWPLAIARMIPSKCDLKIMDKPASFFRDVKTKGRALCRRASGDPREGMELERWEEIELEEENARGLRNNATLGIFVNPFDDRGRSSTRRSSGSTSNEPSPTDCRAVPLTLELPPIRWYEKLPLPAELGDLNQPGSSSNGGKSSAEGTRSCSPYSEDVNGPTSMAIPCESVEASAPHPLGKSKATQKLQTIPEQNEEVQGWEKMIL
ncbi:hypothetical protein CORC01_03696 [Colletotrichum orchidophilum]|uniref:Uncharacterized protein n=1 Tax=Colletotrichum orchidophilum TaxID=1209926 RepID=A0A1G4BHT8_9PEZI|nr:uncharacterized protein CORC01_03696 [Colletotrichum orchidophilum]OHF00868.1 hypothetical protein CORC01_03696 [Colletotrichum orchidophilum]